MLQHRHMASKKVKSKRSPKPVSRKVKTRAAKPVVKGKAKASPKGKAKKANAKATSTIDQRLFELANRHYRNVLETLLKSRTKLDTDRKMILEVGERILNKAKTVRDSLSLKKSSR